MNAPVTNHTVPSFFGILKGQKWVEPMAKKRKRTQNRTASALVYEPRQVGRHQQKQRKREQITAAFSLHLLLFTVFSCAVGLKDAVPTKHANPPSGRCMPGLCAMECAEQIRFSGAQLQVLLGCCRVRVGGSSDLLIWWVTLRADGRWTQALRIGIGRP